jgi:AraC-like DNA-binding protein
MEITLNLITLTHLAAAFFGLLSAMVILYYGFKSNPAIQPLGIAQLSNVLAILVSFALVSQLILQWPFLYRLGTVFLYVFIPMPFLHILFYTTKRSWKWYDLFHALPLVIYLVDYGHVLMLPNAQKLVLIQQEINDLDLMGHFKQSKYFGPRFHQEARTVIFSLYWVAELVVYVKWLRNNPSLTPENKIWRNWIAVYLGCQVFIWFPFYLSLLGLDIMTTYHIVNSFSVAWLLISSLSLFFFPSILYGPKLAELYRVSRMEKKLSRDPLPDAERKKLEEMMLVIENAMETNRYFLTPGYSIHDFSHHIQLPAYQISRTLNHLKQKGFVEFIAEQRIRYCITKFNEGEWMNYTLEAVAAECGFSNRNSFTKSFTKIQGLSPSEYRARQQKTE